MKYNKKVIDVYNKKLLNEKIKKELDEHLYQKHKYELKIIEKTFLCPYCNVEIKFNLVFALLDIYTFKCPKCKRKW